jgi:hypothetical protein
MRGMRYPKAPSMIALAFLAGMAALSACSSDNKTVVALTIKSDDTIKNIDQIVITASAAGHGPVTKMVTPGKDADSGVITASFYERIELDGFSGDTTLQVDAIGAGGATIATKSTTVEVKSHSAVAALVMLSTTKPPVDAGAPETGGSDAGSDADDDAQN